VAGPLNFTLGDREYVGMSRRRSAQLTPLDLAVEAATTGKGLLDGLSRLQRMIYERAPAGWQELHYTFQEFEQGMSFLEYEGLIAATDSPQKCLNEYFAYFRSRRQDFLRAVAVADQLIGRRAFLEAFRGDAE